MDIIKGFRGAAMNGRRTLYLLILIILALLFFGAFGDNSQNHTEMPLRISKEQIIKDFQVLSNEQNETENSQQSVAVLICFPHSFTGERGDVFYIINESVNNREIAYTDKYLIYEKDEQAKVKQIMYKLDETFHNLRIPEDNFENFSLRD
jgi:hypothetical protein